MNFKTVVFGDQARSEMETGVNILADAVSATLGPAGRCVVIQRKFTTPHVTKDGVSVAKEIALRNNTQDMGVQLVLEVAARTNETAGDGTTTATVLARAIVNSGLSILKRGTSATQIKFGIDQAVRDATQLLEEWATPVDNIETLKTVAKISANGDERIADIVAQALDQVGKDGLISVEKGGTKDELEILQGMRIDSGWFSNHFLTSPERLVSELSDASVLLIDSPVKKWTEIERICSFINEDSLNVIMIAHEFSEEIIEILGANFKQGTLNIIPVAAAGYGDRRSEILEDIAIYTNGKVFNGKTGRNIREASTRDLGKASSVIITREETAFINGAGSAEDVEKRSQQIKLLIENEKKDFAIDKLKQRLASLGRGVAIIRVGAFTQIEMKEKKDRFDDAICAVRAAAQEGIVIGGGYTLMKISNILRLNRPSGWNDWTYDQRLGYDILLDAMKVPFKTILDNADISYQMVLAKIEHLTDTNNVEHVFNVATGVYEKAHTTQVIDPVKVTRLALQNAASIGALFLTTQVVIGFDGADETSNIDAIGN